MGLTLPSRGAISLDRIKYYIEIKLGTVGSSERLEEERHGSSNGNHPRNGTQSRHMLRGTPHVEEVVKHARNQVNKGAGVQEGRLAVAQKGEKNGRREKWEYFETIVVGRQTALQKSCL